MKEHCLRFPKFLLLITFLFAAIIVKSEPSGIDSIARSSLSFQQAQPESTHFNYAENPAMNAMQGFAFGTNVWTNELYTFDPDDLATTSVVSGITAVPASGDFAPGDPDHMWLIDINDSHLKKLNVNSGMVVDSFPMPVPLPDGIWSVLTIDPNSGNFYAVATDGTQSVLHQVDENSGNTTLELEMAIPAVISGTFDGNSMLYLFDIAQDNIWVVDVGAPVLIAESTLLGPAGFDGNYAQGMGYDSSTDRVFLAAYNNDTGAELRLLDRTNGNTTLVGELPGETTGFDFPQSQTAMPQLFLAAGQDHYTIPEAAISFGEDVPPIPEGFFNPGSDPFLGNLLFEGSNSNGGEQAQQDLTIARQEGLETPEPFPTEGTVPIEIVELGLTSAQPITVESNNGPTQWDVEVQLQPSAPQTGMAHILREGLNGGVFDMQFILIPVFVFTNVENPDIQKVFNPMEFGFTGLQLFSGDPFPWMVPPIPGEFDPIGEEGMVLVTPSGNVIRIVPFLVRNDNFFLVMDEEGQPEAWEGTGYNNSEWYYYPFTDWWNVWFYDHPFDATRKKLVSGYLEVQPRDPALPSFVEIIVNWSTPEWPQWPGYPEPPLPPLPDEMIDPEFENQMIERSETIFFHEGNITEPIPIPIPSDYLNLETGLYNFNPEWISIDLRGFNFVVSGDLIHICFKPWTGCEVVCPEDMEVCFTDEPFALTGASPAGGVYSGNGVNADGVFDPGNANWGENVITYTYVCPDGTQVSCDFIIYVIPPPEMVCPPNLMVCYGDVVTLSGGLPGGGIYTGPGVSGNTFSSIATGVGSFEITYSVTDPCPGECVFYITVNPNPEVSCPDDFTMCADDDPIDLMTLVSPTGGSFTGGQVFDPSTAPSGVPLQIKYTYTDPDTGCEGSCVFYITVWPEPELQCPEDFTLCADDDPVDLMTLVSPQGGTFSGGQIFDPSQAPPGVPLQTWYTYVDPDTGCEATCIFYITVWPTPEVECPDDMVVCESDDPIDLASLGASPAGGTFTDMLGNVVTVFDPAGMGPASYVFTYCYIDPDTGCEGCCEFAITVWPNPEVECPDDFTMCEDDDPIDLMTLVSPTGGTFSGGQIFDPSTAPPGVPLQFKYTYVDPDTGCEASCVFYITVWPPPEVECPDDFTMCEDDDPIDLMTLVSPTGGTFSGGQIFDPSTAPPGVPLQIKYTYVDPTTGCEASCIFYITVWPKPNVDCPDDEELCIDDGAITLSASPDGGTFSGTGINGDSFDPATAGVGTHTIEYCYIDPQTDCEGCCEFTITVHDLPEVDCPDDFSICIDEPAFPLTGATPSGGSYSGNGVAGGNFSPANAGVGVHTIEYCYIDPDTDCEGCCEFTITVHDLPDVDCPDDMEVCIDEPAFPLTGATPSGGSYSGNGVAGGNFSPANAGVGVHTIEYCYIDPDTDCEECCEFTITVNDLPVVTCPGNMEACIDDGLINLPDGNPAGGWHVGPGVAGGVFNPAAAGVGVHTITYRWTDPATSCTGSCTFTITVHDLPNVTCSNLTVCIDDGIVNLGPGMPAGGTYAGPGVAGNQFNPQAVGAGTYNITYTYQDPNTGCINECEFTITVIDPDVDCPPNDTVCESDPDFPIGGAMPPGGVYEDMNGNPIGIFKPSWGPGTYPITYIYTDQNGCSDSCTFNIIVRPDPVVTCPQDTIVNISDPAFALTGATPVGGVYTDAAGNVIAVFSPSGAGLGVHTITYTYTDQYGCSGSCSFDIEVVEQGQELDFGDAPDGIAGFSYNTLLANAGARHIIDPDVYLGDRIDAETDGQPTLAANGDDLAGMDDEDGVTLPASVVPGSTVTISVKASVDGFLDAWMDFNLNGTWMEPGEHIFSSQFVVVGMNALSFTVPAGASYGQSYLRFRFRTGSGAIDYKGLVQNGEVEDYTLQITDEQPDNLDFGDAPDNGGSYDYHTLMANNGARHVIDPDVFLGDLIDAETDGQPTLAADGDDLATTDDEDGVTLPASVVLGSTVTISVKASVDGFLDAWMDFNLNGTWMEPGEHIFTSHFVVAGMNSLSFTVPAGASTGQSYIRFRFRTGSGAIDYKGLVQNGEVEDYTLQITEEQTDNLDFGDAPDNGGSYDYHTLMANNGARHIIDPDVYLGDRIDGETDGQPTMAADGDDLAGMDDEDGVTLPASVVPGSTVTISVKASVDGFLDGWMDFNLNGTWMEPGEHIFASQFVVAGMNSLSFTVPAGASYGQSYLRFRFRTSTAPIDYKGLVQNGEVEDYTLQITDEQPDNLDFGDAPDNGGSYDYHTLMANNGARHVINPDVFLGDLIDAEINGQPNLPALGDDYNNLDDEDGLRMKRFMAVGDVAKVSVKASVDGFLNAWVDFNRDGKWSGPGEQIFTDEPLVAGWNTFTFMVPTTAEKGRTYARFRYNTTGGLTYEGPAADGEVEDYLVAIYPENWGFEVTDLSHLIVVPLDVNQVLKGSDSYSLMPGDFLGVFFDNDGDPKCGGAISWEGGDNQVLIAYGDDPTTPEKEGFDEGEMMNFKVSVAATGEEFDAQVAFDPDQPNSNGQFQNNGLSALTEIELVGLTQTLEITEGWSGISTYLEPLNTNVEDMFAPVADDLVVLYKLNGSMYWPAQNLNTMGQWYFYDGHVVKMLQDVLLEVNGTEPADKTVQLQEGLNLIPVLSEFPFDVDLLFSTAPGVVLVKEVAGTGVYLPDWGINTIGAVLPGSSYFVMTSEAGIISFDPGSNKAGAVYEPTSVVSSPWDAVENTPGSHVVVFNLNGDDVQQGDVIGGFTADGHCGGVAMADGETFALTLNANDPFEENINGFEAGEQIALKLYREATGETFELEATYSEDYNQQHFATNGLSEVTGLKATATGTHDGLAAEINVYPNPSSGIFNLSHAEDIELIEVMDSYGKLIISEKPGFDMRVDLSDYPTGIYFLKAIATDGSESMHKLIVQ